VFFAPNLAFAADNGAAVESVRKDFQRALNNNSIETSSPLFTDSAKSSTKGQEGNIILGIRSRLDSTLKGQPMARWNVRREGIRFPVSNVALEDVVCIVTHKRRKTSARRAMIVYVKNTVGWQIDEFRLAGEWRSETPDRYLPQIAAPQQHKRVYEDEHVRVFRVTNPPGGVAPAHVHVLPSVVIMDAPASLIVRDENGSVRSESKAEDLPLVSFSGPSRSPYSVQNVDDHPIRLWRIEIKNLPPPIDRKLLK